jgi:hypothetical protein
MPVKSAGAHSHATQLSTLIKERMARSMTEVAEAMTASAKSRAPSMDEEYRELNAESGGVPMVDRSGDSSADSDGRKRFIKPESTYLTNAVMNLELNTQVIADHGVIGVRIGHLPFLNQVTHFSYINLGAEKGEVEHTVPSSPEIGYFTMMEGGTAGAAVDNGITTFTVYPHDRKENGHFYPLRPGEGEDGTRKSMVKTITGRQMFMPLFLQQAAGAVLRSALAELGPARSS